MRYLVILCGKVYIYDKIKSTGFDQVCVGHVLYQTQLFFFESYKLETSGINCMDKTRIQIFL